MMSEPVSRFPLGRTRVNFTVDPSGLPPRAAPAPSPARNACRADHPCLPFGRGCPTPTSPGLAGPDTAIATAIAAHSTYK
jgi:hypothetical protein